MHNRIILHFLKNKKCIACQKIMIVNDNEMFVIFPNYIEVMGNGILMQYVDLLNETHHVNQKGIFHFIDSKFFFI